MMRITLTRRHGSAGPWTPAGRRLLGALGAACLGLALLPGVSAVGPDGSCAPTTMQASLRRRSDGRLECAPGSDLVVRDDLAGADPARATSRRPLLAFLGLADAHVTDEESPLRTEFADKCSTDGFAGSYRPHETMLPHLLNAQVRTASALAASGSPVLGTDYGFAMHLGDATDNKQYNELRWFIDILDGGKLVDPDSGAEGYEGVQGADPRGGSPALRAPADDSLRDLANEPFVAHGLRTRSGGPLPWYAVAGNHDVKVQGTLPESDETWRTFARAWATGRLKINDLGSEHQAQVCEDPSVLTKPAFWTAVAADPGTVRVVGADLHRRPLDREQWIAEHARTAGFPAGHGFSAASRCKDGDGEPLARACYAFDHGLFRFVVLDTNSDERGSGGHIDEAQLRWLEDELSANSRQYYNGDHGVVPTPPPQRYIVVVSHHASAQIEPFSSSETPANDDLVESLTNSSNVVLHLTTRGSGDAVIPRKGRFAYWELAVPALADWASQGRSIEIADNGDGTISIFGVVFDAGAPADARTLAWADDATRESALRSGARRVNEDWLASAAREVASGDVQGRRVTPALRAKERNVELLLPNPVASTAGDFPFIKPPFRGPVPGPGFPFPSFRPGQGFPGFGQVPGRVPGQFPPPFQPPADSFQGTGPGLKARPVSEGGAVDPRARWMLVLATIGAAWLARGRVRRWMVGL